MSKQLVRQLDMLRELQAARYGRTVHELAQESRRHGTDGSARPG